jgi:uncharacterized protein YegL
MKQGLTAILVIIDASGSMHSLATDTIGSLNQFLDEQKLVPGEAIISLYTFNTKSTLVYDFVSLNDVIHLTNKTYAPEGGTALLDAMGTGIDYFGQKLAALPEEERPSKVVTLIVTDGEENSSHRYTAEQIKNMVQHQKDVYSHEFVFMGANIDAITAGTNLGISTNNTLNYVPTSAGTHQLYNTISENMMSYRSAGVVRGASFFQPTGGSTTINSGVVDSVAVPTVVPLSVVPVPVKK